VRHEQAAAFMADVWGRPRTARRRPTYSFTCFSRACRQNSPTTGRTSRS
jgi:hypothetical protein